jgi:hypothetical protein
MIVPEQVKLPLVKTAAAHGAEETVVPPMMFGLTGATAAWAAAGTARTAVQAVAREATTRRFLRTPGLLPVVSRRARPRGIAAQASIELDRLTVMVMTRR